MFIVANFLSAAAQLLDTLLHFYSILLILRVIISWVNADPYNPVVRFLYNVTEPVLYRIRRAVPLVHGGIDFSPLVVLLGVYFLQSFLVRTLFDLATRLH